MKVKGAPRDHGGGIGEPQVHDGLPLLRREPLAGVETDGRAIEHLVLDDGERQGGELIGPAHPAREGRIAGHAVPPTVPSTRRHPIVARVSAARAELTTPVCM